MTTRAMQAQGMLRQGRAGLTPLNLHFAGVAVLALVNLYLLAHLLFAWQTASTGDAAALAAQTARMNAAQVAAQPLRGLNGKLSDATLTADQFYEQRLPLADSQIVAELGALSKRQGVKLTRVSFAYEPVMVGTTGALTEVRMDATLSGDYRPLMLLLNSLERDRTFFLIAGVTLTGQQSGSVNLRIKLISYLRGTPPPQPTVAQAAASAEGAR